MSENEFEIRSYLKTELALLYHPQLPAAYAMNKMRAWIRHNAELYAQMYTHGEGRNDHSYTRRQVQLIVKYLDLP